MKTTKYPCTRRPWLLAVILLPFLAVSCKDPVDPDAGKRVTTAEASLITMDSAQLNGAVSAADMLGGADAGFILSTSPNPTIENGTQIMCDGIEGGTRFIAQVSDLLVSTTYYYKAFINGNLYLEGEVRQFTTKPFEFAAVDLGLNVKWANANLGAGAPYEFGDYYAWGELETKADYTWETYKFGTKSNLTKYYNRGGSGVMDFDMTILEASDDVAHAKLGGNWRIPSEEEMGNLIDTRKIPAYYRWEWISVGGHDGWKVTHLSSGNSIFFPGANARNGSGLYYGEDDARGFYWTSSVHLMDQWTAWSFTFYYGGAGFAWNDERYLGLSIRPVTD